MLPQGPSLQSTPLDAVAGLATADHVLLLLGAQRAYGELRFVCISSSSLGPSMIVGAPSSLPSIQTGASPPPGKQQQPATAQGEALHEQ